MDLSFSKEEVAFREEVRAFFASAVPSQVRARLLQDRELSRDDMVAWQRALNRKGWAVPAWPKEWGGTGWTPVQHYIFKEEMFLAPAPPQLGFGVNMLGPVLYTFGSEAQKKYFLPRIANLDDWWCQGFSEPGAGSDLASVRMTARREGDIYVINGQKTWTTLAQHANWIFCLVRTDPDAKKQAGISFLLVPMESPGITVRPIQTIDGGHEVNEVFFDDVSVPVDHLVGEENKGWTYAKYMLGHERSSIARVGMSKERVRRIKQLASQVQAGGRPLIENEGFRERLTLLEVELKALEMNQLRVVAAESRKEKGQLDPASSILKIMGSEIQQRTTELMLEVIGPFAAPYESEEPAGGADDWTRQIAPTYFNKRSVTIYGGTNEIQRGIIAKAVLGL